jgi:uncharacterized protein YprB with RNaseH-like and TPR domain
MAAGASEGAGRRADMLRHTFCHLQGVGEKTEPRLWGAGITSWDAAFGASLDGCRLDDAELRESARRYEQRDLTWFGRRLPSRQTWRLFRDFRPSCAFLDIETTGLSKFSHVTTIALYDGRSVHSYVHGQNLDDFAADVRRYDLLITYNGKTFDFPFLQRCLGVELTQAHIDLRYVLHSLGIKGGLKGCERQLGVRRPGMEDIDGMMAVLLWEDHCRTRSPQALESLLAYNAQDAINLELLMVEAYNRKLAELGTPFAATCRLSPPAPGANPYRVDPGVIARALRGYTPPRFWQ